LVKYSLKVLVIISGFIERLPLLLISVIKNFFDFLPSMLYVTFTSFKTINMILVLGEFDIFSSFIKSA